MCTNLTFIGINLASPDEETTKFDSESSQNWTKDPQYNRVFLKANQQFMNDTLQARGHVFLNEVYDALGLPRTPLGALVGWKFPGTVNFGIEEVEGGMEYYLKFNVDGVIFHLI